MANKKPTLGKNLNALLGTINALQSPQTKDTTQHTLRHLPIEFLQRGKYQPRREMNADTLNELAESIKAQGVIQPIIVRSLSDKHYEIIAGERRWRAAQIAGLHEVPVVIKEMLDETALAVALIENIQREDLNPVEEAHALQRLIDEFSFTHQEVAQAVGKSRTTVTNLLRVLTLPPEMMKFLEKKELEMGHAKALLGLSGHAQLQAARLVVAKGLSVRETETLVRDLAKPKPDPKTPSRVDPNIRKLEKDLSEKLGARVAIDHHSQGKGKLVIHYHSVEDLDGILARIDAK